jgi:hypothetical protein
MENDVVIWAEGNCPSEADDKAISQIDVVADGYSATDHDGERLRIHIVLNSQSVVDALRRASLEGWMKDHIELYAYSYSDLSAINLLGVLPNGKCRLDFKGIKVTDDKTVHLVLTGCNSYTESIAVHAALVAHYPNYCRDNALCTRITMVAASIDDFSSFRLRYRNLLRHSYCREVKISNNNVESNTFAPKYANTRRDFVDIEWEFVACTQTNNVINYKFEKWANDKAQLTTFVFCDQEDSKNLTKAINLTNSVKGDDYQIFIKSESRAALSLLQQSGRYENIEIFGSTHSDFGGFSSLIKMAQLVNFSYNNMKESTEDEIVKGQTPMVIATDISDDKSLNRLWNRNDKFGNPELNTQKRWSNIYTAYSIPTKLRSIGIDSECKELYAISDKDVNVLAEVEHNRWSVEELILDFEPTSNQEHDEILANVSKRRYYKRLGKHDDLRNFKDLGVDESGKSVVRYDVAIVRCIPLIVYSYNHRREE